MASGSPKCLHLQTLTQAIWIETDNNNATDIGWQPYLATSPTRHRGVSRGPHPGRRAAPKRFVISFISLCQAKGWSPLCLRHSDLGMENSTLFGKRWLGIRNTCPNQRSFWCWTHSSLEVLAF
ncbi:hypothetical protein CSKR_112808 [Clonorchis sinensis]|uniref:Uncharacterized protein n=1 Tax=Clonorchis sinensis TaxID=79923 RepID=A0A3R7CNI3_CLOSI|nr:hypothetical protein CSKR_112808 [Clonorchis sinensis]